MGLAASLHRLEGGLPGPEVDLVDIGTPNYLHLPMARAALQAGKHVACEKPWPGP